MLSRCLGSSFRSYSSSRGARMYWQRAVGERFEHAPAEAVVAVECFRVDRLVRRSRPGPVGQRLERSPAQVAGHRRLHQVEDRRHDVGLLDEIGHAASGVRSAGLFDDQRDVNRFVVQEQAVALLAVVAQSFAVVRDEHDGRLIVELAGLEIAHETADDFIRVGDRPVVRRERAEPLGRRVRRMRFVQVQKQKQPRGADRGQPSFGDGFGFRPVAPQFAGRQLDRHRRHVVRSRRRQRRAQARRGSLDDTRDDPEPVEGSSKKSKPFARPVSPRSIPDDTMPPVA